MVEALFQASRTHIEEGALAAAEDKLNTLIQSYSATPRAKEALVELCLVHVKQGEDDKVLSLWDNIRTNYGNDNVAADAYNIVEPLLIQRGLLDNLPPAVGLDGAEIEQRFFESASTSRWRIAARSDSAFVEYVRQYPGAHTWPKRSSTWRIASLTKTSRLGVRVVRAVLALPAGDFSEAAALGPPPSHGTTDSTAKPWALRDVGRACRPAVEPTWKRPSAKCAATTSWARKTKRPICRARDVRSCHPGRHPTDRQTLERAHRVQPGEHSTVLEDLATLSPWRQCGREPSTSWQNTTTTRRLRRL